LVVGHQCFFYRGVSSCPHVTLITFWVKIGAASETDIRSWRGLSLLHQP
jgi:hypothetical protein